MRGLFGYVLGRLGRSVFVVLTVVTASFFLMRIPAGDLVDVVAGEAGVADPAFVAALRERWGLDRSVGEQFLIYMKGVLSFDLGYSYRLQQSVLDAILARLPQTLILALCVLVVSIVVGVSFGVVAAANANRWPDKAVSLVSLVAYATPNFWLGLMLVLIFSVYLRILPPFGMASVGAGYTGLRSVLDVAAHLVLPVLALSSHHIAVFSRITRTAIREIAGMDFVKTARAKGISERAVMRRHVLRNALLTVVTYAGLQAGSLVNGTVLIETVFALPGVGRLAYDSIVFRDYTLLLGVLIVVSVMTIIINLVTDIVYAIVDPRIELTA